MSVRSLCAARARQIEREQVAAFGVDRRRRRVEVFRLAVAERAAAERDDFAGRRVGRHHEPVAVEVVIAALPALDQAGPCGQREIEAVAFQLGRRGRSTSPARSRARIARSSRRRSRAGGSRRAPARRRRPPASARNRRRRRGSLRRSPRARCGRARARGLSGSSSMPAFAREHAHGVAERRVLELLHEGDDVAAGAAAEALEEAAIRVHVKRRRLLGVKRAESDEVVAPLFERHVLPDKARDVDASADFAKRALIVSHVPQLSSAIGWSLLLRAKTTASEAHLRPGASLHRVIHSGSAAARLPVMQRLRRLRQLGLAYLAFPSAEHSRFTPRARCARDGHARLRRAGARTARTFSRTPRTRVPAAPRARRACCCTTSATVPFSHSCEAVLGVRARGAHDRAARAARARATRVAALDVDAGRRAWA